MSELRTLIAGPKILAVGIISLAALVLSLPLLLTGLPLDTHDGWIHSRWCACFTKHFVAGQMPRWLPEMNGGLGSPAFFYYGPTSFLISAALRSTIPNSVASCSVLGISCCLALLMSGLFTFFWLKRLVSVWPAAAGACLYVLSPYHLLVDLYTRGAVG